MAAPLSLQVHPSAEQAREGNDAENAHGIPVDAPQRRYRDPWPKPELVCALEQFHAAILEAGADKLILRQGQIGLRRWRGGPLAIDGAAQIFAAEARLEAS